MKKKNTIKQNKHWWGKLWTELTSILINNGYFKACSWLEIRKTDFPGHDAMIMKENQMHCKWYIKKTYAIYYSEISFLSIASRDSGAIMLPIPSGFHLTSMTASWPVLKRYIYFYEEFVTTGFLKSFLSRTSFYAPGVFNK